MYFSNPLSLVLAFITAIVIVMTSIPTIVNVAQIKNLTDEPGRRKAHKKIVPTLGGIAIYAGIIISGLLFIRFSVVPEFQYVIIASVILFFIGIKDDILVIAPTKKLLGQIIASLIIIIMADFRFTSLHGFLGVQVMPYWLSLMLTLFVFIVIINGVNLIDGIDGLASGVGVIASVAFGTWFFLSGEYEYAIVAIAVFGSLISFFYFNVFGRNNKIFMGDTGSLMIGLFMAVFAVKFCEVNIDVNTPFYIHAAPSVAFGILIVPLFDTMRVFIIRLLKGHSPFRADRNHVHHKLLFIGLTHLKSTLLILGANLAIIITVFLLNDWGVIDLLLLIVIMALVFSVLPETIFFLRQRRMKNIR